METKKRIRKIPDGQSQISFQIPIDTHEALRELSERMGGASVGSLARMAIADLIRKEMLVRGGR